MVVTYFESLLTLQFQVLYLNRHPRDLEHLPVQGKLLNTGSSKSREA